MGIWKDRHGFVRWKTALGEVLGGITYAWWRIKALAGNGGPPMPWHMMRQMATALWDVRLGNTVECDTPSEPPR